MPKLTYFDIRGLAELSRFLLKYGDIEFQDNRITSEQWKELKSTTPFGQLPLYEEDGKVASQSCAIARYLAKKVGLVGANDWENLEIDSIVDTLTDMRLHVSKWHQEQDETKKNALKETIANETFPFYLDRLEKIAGDNNYHLAANKLTWADFYFVLISDIAAFMLGDELVTKYPNLQAVKKNVVNLPKIKAWIETRPVTPF